jgi:hypothetical protein
MKLLCDNCGKYEKVVLMPDNLMQFECGGVSEITREDMMEFFMRYGGNVE